MARATMPARLLTVGLAALFLPLAGLSAVPAQAQTDVAPPQLVSSSVDTTEFDATPATFTVTATITDETGAETPTLTVSHDGTDQSHGFGQMTRVSGDDKNGTYEKTVTIPAGAATGQWEVILFPLSDTLGNDSSFTTLETITIGGAVAPEPDPTPEPEPEPEPEPAPGPSIREGVSRLSGTDRYATAAAVANAFPQGTERAYVATGADYPDALAGAAVAGATAAPILLTKTSTVPTHTAAALDRLDPTSIYLLSGFTAVTEAAAEQLSGHAAGVFRVAGDDRYKTAALVSSFHYQEGAEVAYVATGTNYPDALAGAALAGASAGPILLTKSTTLPEATTVELQRLSPERIVVLGGTSAVSAEVERQLGAYASTVSRLSGADRYETAAAVARTYDSGVETVFLATGADYPDALAGAALAGVTGGPILLTKPSALPEATTAQLERLSPENIVILGGATAVSERQLEQMVSGG